ncbi:DUF4382 domain-containing protein [Marinobacter panjinensis]|uniref:DUF4382 domain-containing protein n=1 Tax=Marinobacter panjinensis TaxID=2576384 RepID=A0A4U6R7I4_9GAMM|nr:DUF4382 domain-containing protein [Marinobacter panjinensis]TKV69541.1 DUF4382 domain-containing protein [Marinobacter panjinensis]
MNQSLKYLTVVGFTGALAACGGGGSSSSGAGETGSVSVGLTDAPVDSAQEVNIEVMALVLQPSDGERSRFEMKFPEPINLLDLQGGAFETLISDEEVPAGAYNWMRLELGDDNTILLDDGSSHILTTPSARGVQTSGFTVPAGGVVSLTIDFDVRKSLVNPVGQEDYRLKPVLRLVDNSEVGTIKGTVAGELITQECGDTFTQGYAGNVYVHEGADAVTDDIGSENEPLVVASVNDNGTYTYTAAFVPAGEYTVSYTCEDDLIENDQAEPSDDDINFNGAQNVTVVAGETSTADFELQSQPGS